MKISLSKVSLNLAKNTISKIVLLAMILAIFSPFSVVSAQVTTPLTISNIKIDTTGKNATISWSTNRSTYGTVEWGIITRDYDWTITTGDKKTSHSVTITGLYPDTKYYYRITAEDSSAVVSSFEHQFTSDNYTDNKAPRISNVRVPYVTGHTATIQWTTDERATSEVEYGLTTNYGSKKTDGNLVTVHDITLTGLLDATTYQFLVKSKDKDNNIIKYQNLTFKTAFGDRLDKDELIIYDIAPAAENDINITDTSAVISWRTNKLSSGSVRYGTSPNSGSTIKSNPPRDFLNTVTLLNLQPDTTYYYDITAKDVLNKTLRTDSIAFRTKPASTQYVDDSSNDTYIYDNSNNTSTTNNSGEGQVLGARSCDVDLNTDIGFYGYYYNLSSDHPDFDLPASTPWTKIGRQNNWYDDQYYFMDRIDQSLSKNVIGKLPVRSGLRGDPHYFAVNWRAIIEVEKDGFYEYNISSDDDSWLFIDDRLENNFGGIFQHKTTAKKIYLTAGYHKFEVLYADRRSPSASFVFEPLTPGLTFHPLPLGCEVNDVLGTGSTSTGNTNSGGGQVLGVKVENTPAPEPEYACNPNLGYTKIKALYKTTASPDIWALLETGQKHYITSPASFNLYECDWSKIKVVSQSFLDQFDNATLVRTPDVATIYHLFDRPELQWLKIDIQSPTIFVSYAKNFWGNVARINHLDMASYPQAKLIKEENSKAVYLIDGVTKRQFSSAQAFDRLGYDWAEVVNLNQIHLDTYTNGEAIN